MMIPTNEQIVDSALDSFVRYIKPELSSAFAQSIALTVENLLRYSRERIIHEGPLLFEDNADLRAVLTETHDAIVGAESLAEYFEPDLAALQNTLSGSCIGAHEYPSVQRLTEEALALRGGLDDLLKSLHRGKENFADDECYKAVRKSLRQYLGRMVERNDKIITPAFITDRR